MGRCYIFVDTCDVCKIREEFPPIILFYTLKSLIIYVSRTLPARALQIKLIFGTFLDHYINRS